MASKSLYALSTIIFNSSICTVPLEMHTATFHLRVVHTYIIYHVQIRSDLQIRLEILRLGSEMFRLEMFRLEILRLGSEMLRLEIGFLPYCDNSVVYLY